MAAAAAGRFGRREEGFPPGHEGRCFPPPLLSDRIEEEEEEEKRPVKIVAGGGVPPLKVSVER